MNGFLLIDKPTGWTSFDVVAKVRGGLEKQITADPNLCACDACNQELRRRSEDSTSPKRPHRVKVGHSGTLDPFATGLLILAVGKATKQIEQLMGLPKTYEATVKLGSTTDTLDTESEEQFVNDHEPSLDEVKQALSTFVGEIEQIPPKFSALKVNGRRAYDLARKGEEIKLKARKVTVHELELIDYTYPLIKIRTIVSKGTYIRTLAQDIGDQLGSGGYCSELRRRQIGPYLVGNASNVDNTDILNRLHTPETSDTV